jgi:hypothetical protein
MSVNKQDVAIVGVGVVACAACCAGPIVGFLAVIGLGTILGVALFGVVGLAVALVGVGWLSRRRRRQANCSSTAAPAAVLVETPTVRSPW